MGLDMYLTAKKFLREDDKQDASIVDQITRIHGATFLNKRLMELSYAAMYWRNADAIQAWFVINVAKGAANYKEWPVSLDELRELLNICNQVIAAHQLIDEDEDEDEDEEVEAYGFVEYDEDDYDEEDQWLTLCDSLLPHWNADYDEDYMRHVQETANQLTEILSHPDIGDYEFTYYSSW